MINFTEIHHKDRQYIPMDARIRLIEQTSSFFSFLFFKTFGLEDYGCEFLICEIQSVPFPCVDVIVKWAHNHDIVLPPLFFLTWLFDSVHPLYVYVGSEQLFISASYICSLVIFIPNIIGHRTFYVESKIERQIFLGISTANINQVNGIYQHFQAATIIDINVTIFGFPFNPWYSPGPLAPSAQHHSTGRVFLHHYLINESKC